ncbi:TPA: baseplate J/gp47 family protein [Neisseria subflava]
MPEILPCSATRCWLQGNTVDLPAQCTITGTAGNGWTIGQINTLVKPLHDEIDVEVSNITVSSGGVVIPCHLPKIIFGHLTDGWRIRQD